MEEKPGKKSAVRRQWHWLEGNRYGGADGGSMGKLFRNRDSLSDAALLARESVQNSWDAARTLREMLGRTVPFCVKFRYVDYYGAKRDQMVASLGLHELRDRRENLKDDRLPPGNILECLDDPSKPLRVLYVEDWGSHGLFGDPELKDRSHLFLAMYYLGGSKKEAGAGGSYGFGKSALERSSRISAVIAHSVFQPLPDDETTSRLVGFAWWENHRLNDKWFEGRAMFATQAQGNGPEPEEIFDPYRDDASNQMAAALGMAPRTPSDPEQLGTSFMVLDPSIEPEALVAELERWWWPALEDHLFDVSVIDSTGQVLHPKPAANPFVAPFIPGYHLATGQAVASDPKRQRLASDKWRSIRDKGIDVGELGLVVPEDDDAGDGDPQGEQAPMVALIRGPRMVIQYKTYERRRVPLRGAFVASDQADPYLRDTEPSSHDCWDTNPSADVSQYSTEIAKSVLDRISKAVKDMALEIAPPPPDNPKSLALFSSLLGQFLADKKGPKPPPPPGGEPIELQMPGGHFPVETGPGEVKLETTFTVRLAEKAPADVATVEVSCAVFINEEESQGGTKWPLRVRPVGAKHGFTLDSEGVWSGEISKDRKATFAVETEPYSDLWTATLVPAVKRTSDWGI